MDWFAKRTLRGPGCFDAKRSWMERLEVGDIVCDCRFRHLRVVGLTEVWQPLASDLFSSFVPDWLPMPIWTLVWDVHDWWCHFTGRLALLDKDLILEDGTHCSAMHCCDHHDHEWEHPEKENDAYS